MHTRPGDVSATTMQRAPSATGMRSPKKRHAQEPTAQQQPNKNTPCGSPDFRGSSAGLLLLLPVPADALMLSRLLLAAPSTPVACLLLSLLATKLGSCVYQASAKQQQNIVTAYNTSICQTHVICFAAGDRSATGSNAMLQDSTFKLQSLPKYNCTTV